MVAKGQMLEAVVIHWHPPEEDGSGDIAVLEFIEGTKLPPGNMPISLKYEENLWDHPFRVMGFPDQIGNLAHGKIRARLPSGWVQIEAAELPIEPGFSGAPIWDEKLKGVVGIVVAQKPRADAKVAYMIPADVLHRAPSPLSILVSSKEDELPSLTDREWNTLLTMIAKKKCTPFLGAGACVPVLPTGSTIAREWAQKHDYPFPDRENLSRVAQYYAVATNQFIAKSELIDGYFRDNKSPDFAEMSEPHVALAALRLPIYMTTNYDDFMVQALTRHGAKPRQMVCRWNKIVQSKFSIDKKFTPTPETPLVFHLHGYSQLPESLVLTDDDYLDFVVNLSRNEKILPDQIRSALMETTLLFIGYSITDITFRVIFRSIVGSLESSIAKGHIAVQLVPLPDESAADQKRNAQEFLNRYFRNSNISIYWGTAHQFSKELTIRWLEFQKHG